MYFLYFGKPHGLEAVILPILLGPWTDAYAGKQVIPGHDSLYQYFASYVLPVALSFHTLGRGCMLFKVCVRAISRKRV
jgi:hypothetical protein